MDIEIFLNKADLKKHTYIYASNEFLDNICIWHDNKDEDISKYNIAIIGVEEDRHSINNKHAALAPNTIRSELSLLSLPNEKAKIIDLGNIQAGNTVNDTYFAITTVIFELLKINVLPLIIGGTQDITYAMYLAYQKANKTVNIAAIDSIFDLESNTKTVTSSSYLRYIINEQPNFLFNYTNIGYQTYYNSNANIELMKRMYFDIYRLGIIRKNINEAEPLVRNADMVSFDLSAIRAGDFPANHLHAPNGLYAEEACQIAWYAGMSDKLSSFGVFEFNPTLDNNNQSAQLTAQIIWHFIDGYYQRKNDIPKPDSKEYYKYNVTIDDTNAIVFYKSRKTNRWWMEVPYSDDGNAKYERHFLVPCSYNEYLTATKNEIPDKWWQTIKKIN